MHDPHADPESGLRRGPERPAHRVHNKHINREQRELRPGRESDPEHLPPESDVGLPVRHHELQVRALRNKIERQPDRSKRNRHERRDRRAGHTERPVGDPAEDEERRQHDVQDHRCSRDDHPGLEVSGAAQRGTHRNHRELQRHRRDEPQEIVRGQRCRARIRAERVHIGDADGHAADQEAQADDHRQHLRLIEDEQRAGAIFLSSGMRHKRRDADAQHLRNRQNDECEIPGNADARDRFLPQPPDPVQVDEKIQRLKHHRHEHEARRLEEMARDRSGRQVLHGLGAHCMPLGHECYDD